MDITPKEWKTRWPHFPIEEMSCRCGCGYHGMDPELMDILELIRKESGSYPLPVTSGCRCHKHQCAVSYSPTINDWEHNGHAADVSPRSKEHAYSIVEAALTVSGDGRYVNGVGIRMRGPAADRFIHIHRWPNKPFRLWTY